MYGLEQFQIDDFVKYGYVKVKSAFPRETALSCREVLWDRLSSMNIDKRKPQTWLKKCTLGEIYSKDDGAPWADVFTEKMESAISSLVGDFEDFGCGWWMITFPGFAEDGWEVDGNWHIDGHNFQHYIHSGELALVAVMFFSTVVDDGGGTALAEGSHIAAARILAEQNSYDCISGGYAINGIGGMGNTELSRAVLATGERFNIVECTGEAGDVVLLHPLLLHARSANAASVGDPEGVRFMCHPSIRRRGRRPLQFGTVKATGPRDASDDKAPRYNCNNATGAFAAMSPLELSLVLAIAGVSVAQARDAMAHFTLAPASTAAEDSEKDADSRTRLPHLPPVPQENTYNCNNHFEEVNNSSADVLDRMQRATESLQWLSHSLSQPPNSRKKNDHDGHSTRSRRVHWDDKDGASGRGSDKRSDRSYNDTGDILAGDVVGGGSSLSIAEALGFATFKRSRRHDF